jgi:transposase
MEVDWAGDTAALKDNISGKPIPVYVFVTVLPCSGYAYAEGFLNRSMESWITAHVHAYDFFGGVTRLLIPDNLKTGVVKADWYNPVINKTYHEMAEHYGTVVIPTGVRQPKAKASVERAVGILSTWIIAALRNRQFFSLYELNEAMRHKLADFNRKPFQKKPGCRESAFAEERLFLIPLPSKPFELSTWKTATVQLNYHIAVDKINYSVPYEYIKHKVDVRLTKNMVEVFYNANRIASHKRLYGHHGQYTTISEHMLAYKKIDLLILDKWLLSPLTDSESRDLLEIVETRHGRCSTIFSSQFDPAGWQTKIVEGPLAEAVLDRIVHDSYTILIEGEESMRKHKGIT